MTQVFISLSRISTTRPINESIDAPIAYYVSVFKAFHTSGNLILPIDRRVVERDYSIHQNLLVDAQLDNGAYAPKAYLKIGRSSDELEVRNSSLNSIASTEAYYKRIESQLISLSKGEDGDEAIEQGAVDTAQIVLGQLQTAQFAPPAISWHGGDAVVMLWASGTSTFAITITDGEVGYVMRRDKKETSSRDSIAIERFEVRELT